MTTELRDRFDDLVAGVPDHVTADPRRAWRAGSRRRTRRRALTAATVFGAAAAVLAAVVMAPRAVQTQPSGQPGVEELGHPTRIERPWRTPELGGGPTDPIAGWVQHGDRWDVVTPEGRLRRFDVDPEFAPSVSPNGRKVAFVSQHGHGLFISDLVTALGYGSPVGPVLSDEVRFTMSSTGHVFWSPDSVRLAVPLVPDSNGGAPDAVVLTGNRTPLPLEAPVPGAQLLGWSSSDELGWDLGGSVLVTPIRGGAPREITLDPMPPSYLTVSLSTSGDGTLAYLAEDARLLVYAADGRLVATRDTSGSWVDGCPMSWSGSVPWVPTAGGPADVLADGGDGARILADPRLDLGCSVWADASLSGPAYESVGARLFGTSTSWLSWWWRDLVVAGLVALLLAGTVVVIRARLRHKALERARRGVP